MVYLLSMLVRVRGKEVFGGRQGDARLDGVMQQCATRHIVPSLSFLFNVTVIQRSLTCQRPDALAGLLLPFWLSVKQDHIREEDSGRGRDKSMSQIKKSVFIFNQIKFFNKSQCNVECYLRQCSQ